MRPSTAISLSDLERLPRDSKKTLFRAVMYGLALAFLAWSWQGAEIRPMALINDAGNMATFAKDFFPILKYIRLFSTFLGSQLKVLGADCFWNENGNTWAIM